MIFPIFSYTFQIEAETCVSASKSFMRFFMSNSIGLYIHIPFCKHKCPYCDFFSWNADENAFDNYVIELKDKIKYWSEKAKRDVATVYFGGGTPSVLGADRLCDILDFIKFNFNIQNNYLGKIYMHILISVVLKSINKIIRNIEEKENSEKGRIYL